MLGVVLLAGYQMQRRGTTNAAVCATYCIQTEKKIYFPLTKKCMVFRNMHRIPIRCTPNAHTNIVSANYYIVAHNSFFLESRVAQW